MKFEGVLRLEVKNKSFTDKLKALSDSGGLDKEAVEKAMNKTFNQKVFDVLGKAGFFFDFDGFKLVEE